MGRMRRTWRSHQAWRTRRACGPRGACRTCHPCRPHRTHRPHRTRSRPARSPSPSAATWPGMEGRGPGRWRRQASERRGGGPGGRPPPTTTIAATSHGTMQSLERTMIHVLELSRRASVTALAIAPALALLAACGGRAEPQRPAPAVAERVEDPLQPSEAALRTADRVTLTGLELGTMWTFENPPLEYWRRTYGFEATPEWLERVRLASVRFGEICSASFVSPEGLVMTNHHCARDCIEAVSTDRNDYIVEGYYAPSRDRELTCPGLFLDQLVRIDDVTQRVQAATAGKDAVAAARAREEVIQTITSECEQATGLQCQVLSLF